MHEVKPKVVLIDKINPFDNLSRVYRAYRRCYSYEEEPPMLGSPDMKGFIRKMVKTGHESPLEHASMTWHITCSRACSHQLVRHRIASYSQQSQRYVKMDNVPVIIPNTFGDDTSPALARFVNLVESIEWNYKRAIESGIPAEDARYLLPNCTATQIVVSMNFRTLLHFFAERCCSRAQWEIRDIAGQMLEVCKRDYPEIFENAGPKCKRLGRCPEAKPCGERPWAS